MQIIIWLKRITRIVLFSTLILSALPLTGVQAKGAVDPSSPPARTRGERLERIWMRQQRIYRRQGRMLEKADKMIQRVGDLLEKAEENGRDVSVLQAALDAFINAVTDAHAMYEDASTILDAHAGFDEAGKVTDTDLAEATVHDLAAKLDEIRETVGSPGRVLHEALREFREANKPEEQDS